MITPQQAKALSEQANNNTSAILKAIEEKVTIMANDGKRWAIVRTNDHVTKELKEAGYHVTQWDKGEIKIEW